MADERKQLNIRVADDIPPRIACLQEAASAALGFRVTASDIVLMGLAALERQYFPVKTPAKKKREKIRD